jgi:hypothetical protein
MRGVGPRCWCMGGDRRRSVRAEDTGLGDAFQSRGYINAVAHQVAVVLLDYVAEMDADAELDAPVGREARRPLRLAASPQTMEASCIPT